jgi:hypothetical protein
MFIGSLLLYSFRTFERMMGSRKFAAFVALTSTLTTALQALLLATSVSMKVSHPAMGGKSVDGWLAPGPYGLIFALFVLFYKWVPKVTPSMVSFLGIQFSDKSMQYLLGAQLLSTHGWRSAIPGLIGVALGLMYTSAGPLQRFRLPGFVSGLGGMLYPIFSSDQPGAGARRRRQEQLRQQQQQRGGAGGAAGGLGAGAGFGGGAGAGGFGGGGGDGFEQFVAPPASDEDIANLTSLGFTREEVQAALRASGNDLQAAANRLMG